MFRRHVRRHSGVGNQPGDRRRIDDRPAAGLDHVTQFLLEAKEDAPNVASFTSPTTTLAPCFANASAVARPIPVLPPVTSVTLPLKSKRSSTMRVSLYRFKSSVSHESGQKLVRGNDGVCVGRHSELERCLHFLMPEAADRVLHQCLFVTQFCSESHCGLDAGIRSHPDHDQFTHAMFFQLQVKVGVGKATGKPMLLGNHVARLGLEIRVKTAAPRPVGEDAALEACRTDGWNRFPVHMLIAFTPSMMWGDERLDTLLANGSENLPHVRNYIRFLECRPAQFVQLATL